MMKAEKKKTFYDKAKQGEIEEVESKGERSIRRRQ